VYFLTIPQTVESQLLLPISSPSSLNTAVLEIAPVGIYSNVNSSPAVYHCLSSKSEVTKKLILSTSHVLVLLFPFTSSITKSTLEVPGSIYLVMSNSLTPSLTVP
jgi:hypothetical protein